MIVAGDKSLSIYCTLRVYRRNFVESGKQYYNMAWVAKATLKVRP